jgi:hypothetical protein
MCSSGCRCLKEFNDGISSPETDCFWGLYIFHNIKSRLEMNHLRLLPKNDPEVQFISACFYTFASPAPAFYHFDLIFISI